jgi:DNA-binding response OmpR family regulator
MPILIVDDDADTRLALAEYLELQGFKTLTAANGHEAIALALARHPRAIVLDLVMPGISGLEVLQLLKGGPATQRIPILCLTGVTGRQRELTEAGAVDYMLKPVEPPELVRKLRRLIARTPPPV